jgi:hypothetical protein|tara:strand:- start:24 stop:200 length:177 start_codon:yes stop_codon:yes gene_type:complete
MTNKRFLQYLKEIERLKEIDKNISIKINQQFADMKSKTKEDKKQNFDKRLQSLINNLK